MHVYSLLFALAALPAPELGEPGPTVSLQAREAELFAAESRVEARGGVRLSTGGLVLRAEELEYDWSERLAAASGEVILVGGSLALVAAEGTFQLKPGGAFQLRDAEMFQKAEATPLLLAAANPAAARAVGRNALTLKAEHLERVAQGRFLARALRLNPCACSMGTPDWELAASSADLEPGERALLTWPRLYVKGVPVLVLPALYLPLSERRTGFLLPRFGNSAFSGVWIDQPFFLTLGRSWDLTVAAGWTHGVEPGLAATPPARQHLGMRGVTGSAELRYAPSETTSGRLLIAGIDDLHGDRVSGTPLPARGLRGALGWRHATDAGAWSLHADVNLFGDAYFPIDDSKVLAREVLPYQRSQGHLTRRWDDLSLSAGAAWYQDLAAAFPTDERWLFGSRAPLQFQRPAQAIVGIPAARLAGPLRGGVELIAERIEPFGLSTGEPGMAWRAPVSVSRAFVRPMLSAPLAASDFLLAEAFLGSHAEATRLAGGPGGAVGSGARVRAFGGLQASTRLERRFGLSGAWRHAVEPRVALRGLSGDLGTREQPPAGAVVPVDELDFPDQRSAQAVAAIGTRLWAPAGELLRAEVGQEVDLGRTAMGDLLGRLELRPGPLSLLGSARWDLPRSRIASLNAGAWLSDSRGDSLGLGYDRIDSSGDARMRAGLDELFGGPAAASSLASDRVGLSARGVVSERLALSYGLSVERRGQASPSVTHSGGVGLRGECDCWRLEINVSYLQGNSRPDVRFLLDLQNLGSLGG